MPTDLKLPELGENIESGDVIKVLVSAGDTIEKDQPVVELETDKATIEVPSTTAGRVADVKVKAGDTVKIGQVILTIESTAEGDDRPAKKKRDDGPERADGGDGRDRRSAGRSAASADRQPEPDEEDEKTEETEGSEDAEEAEEAEEARETEEVEEVEERSASRAGRGEVVDISRAARSAPSEGEAEAKPAGAPVPAAPSVRRFARELGVNLTRVAGSGPGGRISIEDVKAYTRQVMTAPPGGAGTAEGAPLPDFTKWGEIERRPMRGVRRKTAELLSHAWSVIPHVTQCDRADVTALEELRQRYGGRAEAAGGKLTVTAIALKVAAAALKAFPQFNTAVDLAAGEIVYKQYIHIGVAVDTDRGLLVPVIRDVDRKGIVELSAELAQLAEKARARKLSLEEMQGGCFTITNLGGIGGTSFTPIVNWPEVAILGLSRTATEAVWIDDRFQPRQMLPLSLSYDHRVVDGADAIRFLRWVAEALEQPFLLSLHG